MADVTRQACIVGVGETQYTRWGRMGDRGEWSLACEAVLSATADAGLAIEQIDGLASFSDDANVPWLMQHALGLPRLAFTTLERARDLRKKPVRILAAAQGGNPGWGDGALGSHNMPTAEYGVGNGKTLAARLFERRRDAG